MERDRMGGGNRRRKRTRGEYVSHFCRNSYSCNAEALVTHGVICHFSRSATTVCYARALLPQFTHEAKTHFSAEGRSRIWETTVLSRSLHVR